MAGTLLRRTFSIIFGPTHILTNLFRKSDDPQSDLESQGTSLCSLIADGRVMARPGQPIDCRQVRNQVASADRNSISGFTGPTEGPSRIFVHRDGAERCLGILVTDEMVSITQDIIQKLQIIQKHQKTYDNIEKEVLYAKEMIAKAGAKLEMAESDEAQNFQDYIEMQESNIQDAYERKEALGQRLEIFKTDLNFARESSHALLTQTLGEANLIELPSPAEADGQTMLPTPDQDYSPPKAESIASAPEEACREAAMEDAILQLDNLAEAERNFNDRGTFYQEQLTAFKEAVANGDSPDAQSEFDRQFVSYGQQLTRRLIDADATYKQARMHAIGLGALESDWGEPQLFGPLGEWEAQSLPADEMLAYQASRDWTRVETWIEHQPTSEYYETHANVDEHSSPISGFCDAELPVDEDLVDIDCWDARLDDVWRSVSVYDSVESNRERIDRWEVMRERSRTKWSLEDLDDVEQEQEEELSQTED